MIPYLIALGLLGLAFVLLFVIGSCLAASRADEASARALSRMRNGDGKHRVRDEHAEWLGIGGGFNFHAASNAAKPE